VEVRSPIEPTAVPQEKGSRIRRLLWNYGPIWLILRIKPLRPMLNPERFAVFLRALAEHRHVPGAILEVGCYRGSTAAEAYRLLKTWKAERRYVALDTFTGFVPEQFAEDELLGTVSAHRGLFDFNSRRAVERTFKHLRYDIEVLQGDILTIPDEHIPKQISVCLIDVDLARPIHEGLRRVYPRVAPGGIILVDDCEGGEQSGWRGGRVGYVRFVEEMGLPERYDAGLGIIEVPLEGARAGGSAARRRRARRSS
jgi:O-methyltransferase